MSWNHCTITGEPLEEPVISKLTGHIFEKRVISKHIESLGTCPITGQPMTNQDIIAIQVNKTIRPRNIVATSIPQLLNIFQSEWDTLLTETLNLKQQLKVIRQELSHALYQHDAACRVIARLIRERDSARAELAKIQERAQFKQQSEQIEVENHQPQLGQQLAQQITEKALELNSFRKEIRKGGFQGYSTQEQITSFKQKLALQSLHSTEKPGINCISLNPQNERYIATGGMDSTSLIYDLQEQKALCTFKQHTKKINDVIFVPSTEKFNAITCSDDNRGYLFSGEGSNATIQYTIDQHNAPLTEMSLHPLNTLLVTASKDNSWSFHDITVGKYLHKVDKWDSKTEFNCIQFHPDGHILAAGSSDGTVKLWNLTEDSLSSTLNVSDSSCDLLAFSQNGYQLATCSAATNIVKIWDLRHLTNIMTFFQAEDNAANSTSALGFDATGQFLAIGRQNGINIYAAKNWEKIMRFDGYQDCVADIQFSPYSKSIFAASHDGQLTLYN